MLPSGPAWKCVPVDAVYPTKNKPLLYFRDSVECVQSIMRSPLILDNMDLGPFALFEMAEKIMWIYTEWLSGNAAKVMQVIDKPTIFSSLIKCV